MVIFREGIEWMLRGKSNLEDDKKSEVDVLITIFAVVVEVTRRRMLLLGVAECQDRYGYSLGGMYAFGG